MDPQRTNDLLSFDVLPDDRNTLVFNEYEVARCGGLEAIQRNYPSFQIVVSPAKIPVAP